MNDSDKKQTNKKKNYTYFVHKLNGQLFSYKFTTFTLKHNKIIFSVLP